MPFAAIQHAKYIERFELNVFEWHIAYRITLHAKPLQPWTVAPGHLNRSERPCLHVHIFSHQISTQNHETTCTWLLVHAAYSLLVISYVVHNFSHTNNWGIFANTTVVSAINVNTAKNAFRSRFCWKQHTSIFSITFSSRFSIKSPNILRNILLYFRP